MPGPRRGTPPARRRPGASGTAAPGPAASALVGQAAAGLQAGRLDEAERACEALLAREPEHAAALRILGAVRRAQGRAPEAAALLEQALAAAPDDAETHRHFGLALHDAADHERAIPHLRRAFDEGWPGATGVAKAELLHRLSTACLYLDRNDEAAAYARRLAEGAPRNPLARRHLGWMLLSAKRTDEARAAFAEALRLAPDDAEAAHMLAVLEGRTPPASPPDLVRGTYDTAAAIYETTVAAQLRFRTPDLLRALLDEVAGPELRLANALDLACGTGLMGERLRPLADRLTGVDLSPGMLARAEEKRVYDRLEVGEIAGFLAAADETYDLFACSDALIHVGDLAPLFDGVAARARPGALVLFSVEHHAGNEPYLLDRASVRYRHSYAYVTGLLAERGLTLRAHRLDTIRVDRGQPVTGGLYAAAAAG